MPPRKILYLDRLIRIRYLYDHFSTNVRPPLRFKSAIIGLAIRLKRFIVISMDIIFKFGT